ncbi:dihydrolipoyl dehydrogenase [soil metagenome]
MRDFDLIIIGAGPGGYVCAIRAAQLGLAVACVEQESALGGTCVRVGCIPSKALLESSERFAMAGHALEEHGVIVGTVELDLDTMMKRKSDVVKSNTDGVAYLFKKHGIERFEGRGELKGTGHVIVHGDDAEQELHAEHVVLATGSRVAPLRGVETDGERVVTSTEALAFDAVPESLVVIGAGVIGLELGSVWARLGAKVTVLEYLDRILPGVDDEIAKESRKIFAKQGLDIRTGVRVTGVKVTTKGATVEVEGGDGVETECVLVATGRIPNSEGLGLEAAGVETDAGGRVVVDRLFTTNLERVYAIGDLIHGPMLAHKAEEDGVAVAEMIATGAQPHVEYLHVPTVVYTEPEIASVGHTEEALKENGTPYRKGTFPFQANGRARALGLTAGKVKILAHEETDRVLGVHIVGARAGDLIAECVAAMAFGASSEDIARVVHAHPTLAEAVKEAALAVDGRALHI